MSAMHDPYHFCGRSWVRTRLSWRLVVCIIPGFSVPVQSDIDVDVMPVQRKELPCLILVLTEPIF